MYAKLYKSGQTNVCSFLPLCVHCFTREPTEFYACGPQRSVECSQAASLTFKYTDCITTPLKTQPEGRDAGRALV